MSEPRQIVQHIKEEICKHFNNEMRLADMMLDANLNQEENDYLLKAIATHPHTIKNLKKLTPETVKKTIDVINAT